VTEYKSIGGLTTDELENVRMLKGQLQQEMPQESISMKDAVMYAVNNEITRQE